MQLFRKLTLKEQIEFRTWARKNYTPLTEINGVWHPVVQWECVRMNQEAGAKFDLGNLGTEDENPIQV